MNSAHAIVESFDAATGHSLDADTRPQGAANCKAAGPFLFSASSEPSLLANISAMIDYLKNNEPIGIDDLAYTLQSRRSMLPIRAAFAGTTRERLLESLGKAVQAGSAIGIRSSHESLAKVAGIFTGQGAQWAQMGRELILASDFVKDRIDTLQRALDELSEPPSWSIMAELMAGAASTRVDEPAIAQPICTALQIVIVDLLRRAGVNFSVVVGHSSGEIAAAYASGFLSSSDAIRVAYYRGYHVSSNCIVENDQPLVGSMLAANIPFQEALILCSSDQFLGRLGVGACNSPTSVTLSGDASAVLEAQNMLEEAGTVSKVLRVKTAYHSHHMAPALEPYLRSLRACGIQVRSGNSSCKWISSVTGSRIEGSEGLADSYWTRNLTQMVVFSEAIQHALQLVSPSVMIEVGPHPALARPVFETAASVLPSPVPYWGTLRRGMGDVEAMSDALGRIWEALGSSAGIDFEGYRTAFSCADARRPVHVRGLPTYRWSHEQVYWAESRISRNHRLRRDRAHELLGHRCPDDSDSLMRWKNVLRTSELPWLSGHSFQGQAVFPASAYITMALEASKFLWKGLSVQFIELEDVVLSRAIVLDDGLTESGVETDFALQCREITADLITADFLCCSCPENSDIGLQKNCSGRIRIVLNNPSAPDDLQPRRYADGQVVSTTPVDTSRFYTFLSELGLEYRGLFRALASIHRVVHKATSSASWSPGDLPDSMLVHPAFLDVAFQSLFASIGSTHSVWLPYLPTSIRRVRVYPATFLERSSSEAVSSIIEAHVTDTSPAGRDDSSTICGDLEIFNREDERLQIYVEGLSCTCISSASGPSSDRLLFFKTVWEEDIDGGLGPVDAGGDSKWEDELLVLADRISYVLFRDLRANIRDNEVEKFEWHHRRLFEYIDVQLAMVSSGSHPVVQKEWIGDTRDDVLSMLNQYSGLVNFRLARAVYENFPAVLRGEISTLEVLMHEDMLVRLYDEGIGFPRSYSNIARIVAPIVHRYPRMNILEVGAGTGGMTNRILETIGDKFLSYTYTDISSGFFEKVQERFGIYASKMSFRSLNIERDVGGQGFEAHSFDLVIAANVLHATRKLGETVAHVRQLLKPGGYLLLLEITGDTMRSSFLMGGLPGWWLGGDDGRRLFPGIKSAQWDSLLRSRGFSGVDIVLRDAVDEPLHMYSAMLTQATTEDFDAIRRPLGAGQRVLPRIQQFLVVGGATPSTLTLVDGVCDLLQAWQDHTLKVDCLESLLNAEISPGATVLCLAELDRPAFYGMSPSTLSGMQKLFGRAKQVLWLTQGCRSSNPHSEMRGVARVLLNELPHVDIQMLDLWDSSSPAVEPRFLVESLLRLMMKEFAKNMLCSTEPELGLRQGRVQIPRIVVDKKLNDRFNSSVRQIREMRSTAESELIVQRTGNSYGLVEGQPIGHFRAASPGRVVLHVRYSTLQPVQITPGNYLFVCLGSLPGQNETVIALSRSGSSAVETPVEWTCQCGNIPEEKLALYLQSLVAHLVAQQLLSALQGFGALLLHEPPRPLANVIDQRSGATGVRAWYTTATRPCHGDGNKWIYTSPHASGRQLKKIIPDNVGIFVDWSGSQKDGLGVRVRAALPSHCTNHAVSQLCADQSMVSPTTTSAELRKSLEIAVWHVLAQPSSTMPREQLTNSVISPNNLSETVSGDPFTILDWTVSSTYPVNITQLDPRQLLAPDKTYLLVGLTGDIGRSLGGWMIRHGARNLVMTSRNPDVDAIWLREMHTMGANVKVLPMDVADKGAVISVRDSIRRTMPRLAGVVNGAMVLSDIPFSDMPFSTLEEVMRPKVDGSINLDEVFGSANLDFFILLSSVSSIIGISGQSNYAAANSFMMTLAAIRRQRGLAASVINIGLITELGYVARAGRRLEESIRRKQLCKPVSEPELHHMFAEAILASRPDSDHDPELTTGLPLVWAPKDDSGDDDGRPPWFSSPLVSTLIEEAAGAGVRQDSVSGSQFRQELAAGTSEPEVVKILQNAFSYKLALMLQLDRESIDPGSPLVGLGIDSLMVIEIRSWFIKDLKLDIPVLYLSSGKTIKEICEELAEKFLRGKDTV